MHWYDSMITSSNGNIFRVTGSLCGEFTGHRWILLTKASDAERWCFLWIGPDQTEHCKPRVAMMSTLSSLVAHHVVITTTCGTTSEDKVGIMTTPTLQWGRYSIVPAYGVGCDKGKGAGKGGFYESILLEFLDFFHDLRLSPVNL